VYYLGGNDLGAKLLRQFDDYHHIDIDLYIVINIYRQETDSAEKIIKLIDKIEGMGGFKVTGLIDNSNLLRETTLEDVLAGDAIVKQVSKETGLPVVFSTVWDQLDSEGWNLSGELLKLKLYFRKNWL